MERNQESGRDTLIRILREVNSLYLEARKVSHQVPGAWDITDILAKAANEIEHVLEKKAYAFQDILKADVERLEAQVAHYAEDLIEARSNRT